MCEQKIIQNSVSNVWHVLQTTIYFMQLKSKIYPTELKNFILYSSNVYVKNIIIIC